MNYVQDIDGQISFFTGKKKPAAKRRKQPKPIDPEQTYDERMKRFLHYMNHKDMHENWIETAPGELRIVVDALADYRDIIVRNAENQTGYQKAAWLNRADVLGKIQGKIEESIDYNRDKQLETCQKKRKTAKDDIGEDAFTLAVNGRR